MLLSTISATVPCITNISIFPGCSWDIISLTDRGKSKEKRRRRRRRRPHGVTTPEVTAVTGNGLCLLVKETAQVPKVIEDFTENKDALNLGYV